MTAIMLRPAITKLTPLSSGAKTELLILQVARAMLLISIDADKSQQIEGAVLRDKEDNCLHKINTRIDRRIKKITDKIDAIFDKTVSKETYEWISAKAKSKIIPALLKVKHHDLQLELAAIYMLYINFCERTQPLHPSLESLRNPYLYFDEIDIIKQTNITEDDEYTAHTIAIDIIKNLRG